MEKPVMHNTLSENSIISGKNISERIWYILLGGSNESMEKRVNTVISWIKKNLDSKVIVTWYDFEIKKIKDLLKEALINEGVWENFDRVNIQEVLSYDTRTNIRNVRNETHELPDFDRVIVPTSESHGRRVEMVFERLFKDFNKSTISAHEPQNNNSKLQNDKVEMIFDRKSWEWHDKFILELLKSWESEVNWAKIMENIYRTNIGSKMLQYAAIALRPKKFVNWYLIPLMKKGRKEKSKKSYLLRYLFWSNKRYVWI